MTAIYPMPTDQSLISVPISTGFLLTVSPRHCLRADELVFQNDCQHCHYIKMAADQSLMFCISMRLQTHELVSFKMVASMAAIFKMAAAWLWNGRWSKYDFLFFYSVLMYDIKPRQLASEFCLCLGYIELPNVCIVYIL